MDTPTDMKALHARLMARLDAYNATPEGRSHTLREDLSLLIIRRLEELGWTQKQLAQKCGKNESFISRIIHTDTNATFEVAAAILHALDIQPRLVDARTLPADHPQAEPDAADAASRETA